MRRILHDMGPHALSHSRQVLLGRKKLKQQTHARVHGQATIWTRWGTQTGEPCWGAKRKRNGNVPPGCTASKNNLSRGLVTHVTPRLEAISRLVLEGGGTMHQCKAKGTHGGYTLKRIPSFMLLLLHNDPLYDEHFSQEGERDPTGRGASPHGHRSVEHQFTQQSVTQWAAGQIKGQFFKVNNDRDTRCTERYRMLLNGEKTKTKVATSSGANIKL